MKYNVGDKVKVIDQICGHQFDIGEIITIEEVTRFNYKATKEGVKWALTEDEIECSKTKACSDVLKLMDKDYSYSESLEISCTLNDIKDPKQLEEELSGYI